MTIVVLGFFAVDTLENAPATFSAMVGITALAVVIDWESVPQDDPGRGCAAPLRSIVRLTTTGTSRPRNGFCDDGYWSSRRGVT